MNANTAKHPRPKRHHYVPRFYLDRFADQRGQICVVDRRNEQKTVTTGTKNAAVVTGFYAFLDEQGLANTAAEERLATLERDTKIVLESLDSGRWRKHPPTHEERDILGLFMGAQIARTPEYRNLQRTFQEIHLREQYGYLFAYRDGGEEALRENLSVRLQREPTSADLERALGELGLLDAIEELHHDKFYLEWFLESSVNYGSFLVQLPWRVVESRDLRFLTTDRPIALWRMVRSGQERLGPAIATAEMIYFPLDPRHVLVMERAAPDTWSFLAATEAEVRRVNARVAHWATRYIFHTPSRKIGRFLGELGLPPHGPTMHIDGDPIPPDVTLDEDFMRRKLGYGDGTEAKVEFGLRYHVTDRKRRRK